MSEHIEPYVLPHEYRNTKPLPPKLKRTHNVTRPQTHQTTLSKAPLQDGVLVTLDDIGVDKEWRVWVNPDAIYPGAASNPIPVIRVKEGYYYIPLWIKRERWREELIPNEPDRESFADIGFVLVSSVK
ncbi:MAG: hypothetical protein ACLP56_05375 [Candidatus Sulfotelmatobacter sp.]